MATNLEFISIKKAQEMLDLPLRTLYRRMADGTFKTVKFGRCRRIYVHSVREFVRKQGLELVD